MDERPIENKAVQPDEVEQRSLGTAMAVHVAQGIATGAAGAVTTHYLRRPKAAPPETAATPPPANPPQESAS